MSTSLLHCGVNSFLRAVSVGGKIQRPAPRLLAAIVCVAAEPGVSLGCMVVTVPRFHEPMLPLKAVAPLNMPGAACSFSRWVRVGGLRCRRPTSAWTSPSAGRPIHGLHAAATAGSQPDNGNSTPAHLAMTSASLQRCKVHGVKAVEVTSEACQ